MPLMARLMFSRRELRLVWEADSVVTRPLFPLRLEIIVVTASGEMFSFYLSIHLYISLTEWYIDSSSNKAFHSKMFLFFVTFYETPCIGYIYVCMYLLIKIYLG